MGRTVDHAFFDNAKQNKNDEFYTQMSDIERELANYKTHFSGKIVYCNCDDPTRSNFYRFFAEHFHDLGLKKVIASCISKPNCDLFSPFEPGFFYEYTGVGTAFPTKNDVHFFSGDGDFRSKECLALLEKSDVVVTNPPFSLFREFIGHIVRFDKQFLVIANVNALTYKEIFKLIQENKAWMGVNMGRGISGFIVPDHYELYGLETKISGKGERIVATNNCMWLTNLDLPGRHDCIPLVKTYCGNESAYPKFDNYDAINVDRTRNIPCDYDGVMGVPITFLHRFNPAQFEIVKFRKGDDGKDLTIGGRTPYFRILIRPVATSILSDRDVATSPAPTRRRGIVNTRT